MNLGFQFVPHLLLVAGRAILACQGLIVPPLFGIAVDRRAHPVFELVEG
jgi:hypothetical protein